VKRALGNPGKRPLSRGALAVAAPCDREPANPEDVFAEFLDTARTWLADSDRTAVNLLRQALEERAALREAVLKGHGNRRELRELDKQIISQLSALGLDPTARSRLGFTEVKAASVLENLVNRKGG